LWNDLYDEIESAKTNVSIISSEAFCLPRFGLKEINILKNRLQKYNTKIILYLRRQEDQLESAYKGIVEMPTKYSKDITTFLNESKVYDYYEYDVVIERWAMIFGRENIIIRIFEEEKPNGLLHGFLKIIDNKVDVDQFTFEFMQNVSPPLKVVKVMRFMNYITQSLPLKYKRAVRARYTRYLNSEKLRKVIGKIPDFLISKELLTDKQRNEIIKRYKESNEKVARKYLGRADGKIFS